MTTEISETQFVHKNRVCHVFCFGKQRNERMKWVQCFELVSGVIWQASLAHLNCTLYEDSNSNAMADNINGAEIANICPGVYPLGCVGGDDHARD